VEHRSPVSTPRFRQNVWSNSYGPLLAAATAAACPYQALKSPAKLFGRGKPTVGGYQPIFETRRLRVHQGLQAVGNGDPWIYPIILNPNQARNDVTHFEAGVGKDPMVEWRIARLSPGIDEDVTAFPVARRYPSQLYFLCLPRHRRR